MLAKVGASKYLFSEWMNKITVTVNTHVWFFPEVFSWQNKSGLLGAGFLDTVDCSRKFKYLETFDLEGAWFALELYGWGRVTLCSFIKQLQNPSPMPGAVLFLLRKCNYLI